ncbi:MAG: hypothetical protein ACNA7O_19650 [Rhodobacterales bacterium]
MTVQPANPLFVPTGTSKSVAAPLPDSSPAFYTPAVHIPRDNRYRLPHGFVSQMQLHRLGADALRLIHAMLHATCRDNPDWTNTTSYVTPEDGYKLRLSALHTTIGPARSNDCRSYLRGIAVLRKSGLFDFIDVLHNGQVLHWNYGENFLELLFADDRYGLLDIAAIGELKRAVPIALYTEICLRRWMPMPSFELNVDALCALQGPGNKSWGRVRAPFIAALQAIAARENMQFFVGLQWRYRLSGVDMLKLCILHEETRWTPSRLCKLGPNARGALIVTAQDVQRLHVAEVTPARMTKLLR